MKTVILSILLALTLAGCSTPPAPSPSPTAGGTSPSPVAAVYTCPMHPEVTSDKPGKCPKCKMDLVLKK